MIKKEIIKKMDERMISIDEMMKKEKMIKNHLILSEKDFSSDEFDFSENRLIMNQFFFRDKKEEVLKFRYEIYLHHYDNISKSIKRLFHSDKKEESLKEYEKILKEKFSRKKEEKKEIEKIS